MADVDTIKLEGYRSAKGILLPDWLSFFFLFFLRCENSILIVSNRNTQHPLGWRVQTRTLNKHKPPPYQSCFPHNSVATKIRHTPGPPRGGPPPRPWLLTQRRSHGHCRFITSCQQHFIFSFQHPVLQLPWPFLPGCQRAGCWRGPCGDWQMP